MVQKQLAEDALWGTEFSNKSVDWTDELVRACSRCRQRE